MLGQVFRVILSGERGWTMPQQNGVLVASALLISCLGMNLIGFPEVWKMVRTDTASLAREPKVPAAPVPAATVSEPKPQVPVKTETPQPAKKSVPMDEKPSIPTPPPPKPAEPEKKPEPTPRPVPVKPAEPAKKPEPKPTPPPAKPAEPVKKLEPKPAESPKKVEPVPEPPKSNPSLPGPQVPAAQVPAATVSARNTAPETAFAPIVPLHLAEKKASPSVPAPAYTSEFGKVENPLRKPSNGPVFDTIDSALQRPVVYELNPTLDQRVEQSVRSANVPKPLPVSENSGLQSLAPLKRLPPTE